MKTDLFIDDLIVPHHITEGYLKACDEKILGMIEEVYQRVKKSQLDTISDARTPGSSVVMLVAGTHGVGKSSLVKSLKTQRTEQYVECDVDSILGFFPCFQTAIKSIPSMLQHDFYDTAGFHKKIEEQTSRYLPAAKYISDRLMSECVREGINVIVETNAKTKNIGSFIDNIKTHAVLETHICQAPWAIKQTAFYARVNKDHDIAIPEKALRAEHEAMTENMAVIAAKSNGNLTIYWRQDANAGLIPAAVATEKEYTRDLVAYTGFNAYFADNRNVSIENLMGKRLSPEEKAKLEAKAKQTAKPVSEMV